MKSGALQKGPALFAKAHPPVIRLPGDRDTDPPEARVLP